MYQVIDDKEYSLNEQMGLPENARFTDVVAYWGSRLSPEQQAGYFEFLSISRLLECFQNGENHVFHKYWTKSAVFKPMLAEQHIVMYEDEESGDILAVTYILDLTSRFKEEEYKRKLEDNPEHSVTELSVRLLSSVGAYVGGLKENLSMMSELENQKTHLEEQTLQLEKALADATLNSEIVDSISKLYWLIYRMDLISETYEEVSAGHEMHRLTGRTGNTTELFKEVCEKVVSKEYQKIMKTFLDVSTLPERLKDTESVALEYLSASGSWHMGRFIVKKRDEKGNVINVLYVVRQIDKQKQLEMEYKQKLLEAAEDARRANMAKTDFLRRMSHDIRTPINGIQGMISIAEHCPDDKDKQKECRDKIKEASSFLLELVNDILDMNKLESGAVVLEHKPFNLLQVLRETNSIAAMNGILKKLSVSMNHEQVYHTHLIGSPLHFKQVLQNIVGNAVKYNREGGAVQLSCEEISCENGRAFYRFICSDTGRGMSREFIKHAFEPFTQEEINARSSYTGTGLGLAIAKQLVEKMGGEIEVESEVNVGTTFTVLLPFEVDTAYEEEMDAEEKNPDEILSGVRVLLAEDNEINIEVAEFILEKCGYKGYNGKKWKGRCGYICCIRS